MTDQDPLTLSDQIRTEREDALLRVIIERPEKANALTHAMLRRLTVVFRDAGEDDALRVLTLQGAGGRVFSGGADLSELSTDPQDPGHALWEGLSDALAGLQVLTIALINGPCIGGGMTLALGCDIRLAAPEALFGYPVLRNGVLPEVRDAARLRALIGSGRTSLILLGGERVAAAKADAWGLVDRIVPRDALARTAAALSEAALAGGPTADSEDCCQLESSDPTSDGGRSGSRSSGRW